MARRSSSFRSSSSRLTVRKRGIVLRIVAAIALLWLAGFLWFLLTLPGPAPLTARTDAVVVLTGGAGRLERGVAVVDAGAAAHLLISGVGRATRRQVGEAAGIPKQRMATIDLGYEAVDTRSNAEETAKWVADHKFRSIRLVTSAGHMRRARLELSRTLPPEVVVLSDAVPVEPQSPVLEYSKFILRAAAIAVGVA